MNRWLLLLITLVAVTSNIAFAQNDSPTPVPSAQTLEPTAEGATLEPTAEGATLEPTAEGATLEPTVEPLAESPTVTPLEPTAEPTVTPLEPTAGQVVESPTVTPSTTGGVPEVVVKSPAPSPIVSDGASDLPTGSAGDMTAGNDMGAPGGDDSGDEAAGGPSNGTTTKDYISSSPIAFFGSCTGLGKMILTVSSFVVGFML